MPRSITTLDSLDLSLISLSDEDIEAMEEGKDSMLVMKEEVEEHRRLQEMFGRAQVVHVANPFYAVS